MFICNACLEQNFTNSPSFIQSYGPCEWCKVQGSCSDIPSSGLQSRRRRKKTVEKVTVDTTEDAEIEQVFHYPSESTLIESVRNRSPANKPTRLWENATHMGVCSPRTHQAFVVSKASVHDRNGLDVRLREALGLPAPHRPTAWEKINADED